MNKETGDKFDEGKIEWDLLQFEDLEEVIRGLMFGKNKYSRDNWKHVKGSKFRYFSAAMRHLIAWFKGQKTDKESGLPHLAHAICCILFLMFFDRQEGKK